MKKLIALLIVAALTASLFAFSGCSDNDSNGNNDVQQTQDGQEGTDMNSFEGNSDIPEGSKLSEPYVNMMKDGKYYLHYKSTEEVEGVPTEGEYIVACQDDNLYMSIETGEYVMKTISDEKTMYIIDDASKTYYKMSISEEGAAQSEAQTEEEAIPADVEYVFISSGETEFDGKTLYYEEYNTGGSSTMRYYFEGDKLYAIDSKYDEGSTVMYIIEMRGDVDASIFEVPSEYKEVVLG